MGQEEKGNRGNRWGYGTLTYKNWRYTAIAPALALVPALACGMLVGDFSGANLAFENWRFYDEDAVARE